jgi:hypothetical protein
MNNSRRHGAINVSFLVFLTFFVYPVNPCYGEWLEGGWVDILVVIFLRKEFVYRLIF